MSFLEEIGGTVLLVLRNALSFLYSTVIAFVSMVIVGVIIGIPIASIVWLIKLII